jgi:hypothetical protein
MAGVKWWPAVGRGRVRNEDLAGERKRDGV